MSKASLLLTSIFILSGISVNSAENPKPQVKSGDKICFIGDSITAMGQGNPYGYVNLAVAGLKANGIDVKWQANCGGGQTSQGVIENFMPPTLTYKPDFVTIVIGTNDVGHQKVAKNGTVTEGSNGVFLPRYKKNYREFTDKLTQAGIQVLIVTPPPHGEPLEAERDIRLRPYVAFLHEFSKEKGYPLVDLHQMMREEIVRRSKATGEKPRYIVTCDGCHMNPTGDMLMAKAVLKIYGLTDQQIKKAETHWLNELNPDVPIDCLNIPLPIAKKFESLPKAKQEEIKKKFSKFMTDKIAATAAKSKEVAK